MLAAVRLMILAAAALCLLAGCEQHAAPVTPPAASREKSATVGVIVAVGDSLTAGYGINQADAYPAQLERKLQAAGQPWQVINAGISGETSSGTLSRVAWILKLKPDIVILETGANDGLRGVDPRLTRQNIAEIVRILQQERVTVVLAGMRMVTSMGRDFTDAFAAIYPALAQQYKLLLIPFFLQGVAGDPRLNQDDGIHPTAEGYRIVTDQVYPYLLQAIAAKR